MTRHYLIQPRDTVLFRDGRPFGLTGSEGARSLPFPVPATTAGLLRTLAGQDSEGIFQAGKEAEVKRLHVIGPLLVRIQPAFHPDEKASSASGRPSTSRLPGDTGPGTLEWLLPAPGDVLLRRQEESLHLLPLRPLQLPRQASFDLAKEVRTLAGPALAQLAGSNNMHAPSSHLPKGKPQAGPPYWHWSALQLWLEHEGPHLLEACRQASSPAVTALKQALEGTLLSSSLADLGHHGPEEETRTHVGISPGSGTALQGALYQTRGRTFFLKRAFSSGLAPSRVQGEGPSASHAGLASGARAHSDQLGLVVGVTPSEGQSPVILKHGPVPLGGERRLSLLSPLDASALQGGPPLSCPASIRKAIHLNRACRLLLVTPGHFKEGSFPSWLLSPGERFRLLPSLELEAAVVDRPQTISGWDMEKRQPKPTIRLVRAGAVYFLHVPDKWQAADLDAWIDTIWMKNVSDHDEPSAQVKRRDGFGLALLGVWSGQRIPTLQEDPS